LKNWKCDNFREHLKKKFINWLKFPKEGTFGLTSQIKRSVSSIGACLAEGSGKITAKDKAHYTNMTYTLHLKQ